LRVDRRRPFRLARQRSVDDTWQNRGELRKKRVDHCRLAVGLVGIEERLIGARSQERRLGLRHFAHQLEHALQRRQDGGEIIGRARLAPSHLAARAGLGESLDQIRRQRIGMAPGTPHLAEIGALPGIEIVLRRGAGEEIGQRGVGQHFVRRLVAGLGVFGQGFGRHGVEGRRHTRIIVRGRRRVHMQDARQNFHRVGAGKRGPASQAFVKHRSQGEQVAAATQQGTAAIATIDLNQGYATKNPYLGIIRERIVRELHTEIPVKRPGFVQ